MSPFFDYCMPGTQTGSLIVSPLASQVGDIDGAIIIPTLLTEKLKLKFSDYPN